MHITFKASGYELTDVIRARVEEKIGSVQKLLGAEGGSVLCEVELERVHAHQHHGAVYRVEVNMDTGKKLYRATAEEDTMEIAIDTVASELLQEVRKDRGRARRYFRRGGAAIKNILRFGR